MARLRALVVLLAIALGLPTAVGGCYSPSSDDDVGESEGAISRGVDIVARFPEPPQIQQAMEFYHRDAHNARARESMKVDEFFGSRTQSSNENRLRVEFVKPNPRHGDKPIAFLRADFHGTDMYWNNRYKDVQIYKLVESTGGANPFPEAVHVAHEGSALVRMWTDYTPVNKGTPEGLHGEALKGEIARITVWSYVSGNVDGPATNGNNGGFARFRDPSGREFWRGVLIDAGAAWNPPSPAHQPWNVNILGHGPVEKAHLPKDVINGLIQIARATREELAARSKFEKVDEGALDVCRDIRARAQQVLEHYGIQYTSSLILRFPTRRGVPAQPQRIAA